MTPEQEIAALRAQTLELSDRLDALEKVRAQEIEQIPPLEDDPGVPRVSNIGLLGYSGTSQLDEVVIGFEEPRDHPAAFQVEAYELYTKGTTSVAQDFVKTAEATRSPFVLPIASNVSGVLTIVIRTRMKGGLGTPVETSPSYAIDITALSNEIAANSITDAMLQRSGPDPIQIVDADILNVDGAKINNASITTAKIVSLEAAKISAGTINSVNINAGTYTLLSGNNQMLINGTNGFLQYNSAVNKSITLDDGTIQAHIGTPSASSTRILLEASTTDHGIFSIQNDLGFLIVRAAGDGFGSLGQVDAGHFTIFSSLGAPRVRLIVNTSGNGEIQINGSRVVTNRQATVADPTGGGTQDAEARTAINAIIDRLQAHGLIS